jgi:hypothetical protein
MISKGEGIAYLILAGLGVYVAVSIFSRVKGAGGAVLDGLNPTNPNNVFARAADAVTQLVTGDPNTSLGSTLYDVMNPNAPRADAPVEVGAGRVSPSASKLVAQFGGSKLTREDQQWMAGQLYGADVQTADVDDAEQGQWFRASNPDAMAADRLLFGVKIR